MTNTREDLCSCLHVCRWVTAVERSVNCETMLQMHLLWVWVNTPCALPDLDNKTTTVLTKTSCTIFFS